MDLTPGVLCSVSHDKARAQHRLKDLLQYTARGIVSVIHNQGKTVKRIYIKHFYTTIRLMKEN